MWDVVLMPRVEDASLQCSTPGVPVELVDIDDAESVLGSSASVDAPDALELTELQLPLRPHFLGQSPHTRPRISQTV